MLTHIYTKDGTAIEETADSEGMLTKTPVSAGSIKGPVRVTCDLSGEPLENGGILIAPSIDPRSIPLFLNAVGPVMKVDGRMTHGMLAAQEYGLPAVAPVSHAAKEIRTGELIRIDGKCGSIELLDRSEQSASVEDFGGQ